MILDDILAAKKQELITTKEYCPVSKLLNAVEQAPAVRDFRAAVSRPGAIRVIAEFKQASPSKGLIRADLTLTEVVAAYGKNGAAAMSILTEQQFFKGSPEFLRTARQLSPVPLLRKDFIIDEYQIYEARVLGADAVLLIVAALGPKRLKAYLDSARALGMECLVEVHNRQELEMALEIDAAVIGINNRNLYTFETSLEVTASLADLVPPNKVLVSESGITGIGDLAYLKQYHVNAVLIGELLMRSPAPGEKLREMAGVGVGTD